MRALFNTDLLTVLLSASLSAVCECPSAGGIVVKFELFELYYWLELYELYYKWHKVHKVKNANNCVHSIELCIEFECSLI